MMLRAERHQKRRGAACTTLRLLQRISLPFYRWRLDLFVHFDGMGRKMLIYGHIKK
jgi:hypothetical protein